MDQSTAPEVLAVGRALPPHFADQQSLIAAFRKLWEGKHHNLDRLEQVHRATRVRGRRLALPLEAYEGLSTFSARNEAWRRAAIDLGARAVKDALDCAGVTPAEVDHLVFTTVTGVSTPSVDATIANRLGLRTDLRRTPMFGLGCVAGAAGVARTADYLRGQQSDLAVLLSVELCSLTLQSDDHSMANVVATGLFGDGAAAVVMAGCARPGAPTGGPRVVGSRVSFYPDTEWVMGWDVVDGGFKVVLSAEVPRIVREHVGDDVDAFLRLHGLRRDQISHWICHPGGPKVLEALAEGLELRPGALDASWKHLEEVGNLSSASVLFILGNACDARLGRPGEYGMLLAMGPGFQSEMVLLRW